MLANTFNTANLKSDFIKVISANMFNSGSVFIMTLILVKKYSQSDFAWIGLGLAYAFIISKLIDFGLSFTALRFLAKHRDDPEGNLYIGLLFLEVLLATLFLFIIAVSPFGPYASIRLFGHSDQVLLLLTVLTAGSLSFFTAIRADFQARQEYDLILLYHITIGLVRLSACIVIWLELLPAIKTYGLFCLYIFPVFFCSLFSINRLSRYTHSLFNNKNRLLKISRSMLIYSPWVWLSGTLFVFTIRVPIIVFGNLGHENNVAIFAAVLSFISVISLINDSVRSVVLPRSVNFLIREEYELYLSKIDKYFWKILISLIFALIPTGIFVKYFLPTAYLPESLFVFYILGFSMLVTTLFGATTSLIHALGHPEIETILNAFRAGAVFLGTYYLVSCFKGGVVAVSLYCSLVIVIIEFGAAMIVRWKVQKIAD